MKQPLFTPEELAELEAIDAEIDASDITQEEIVESRQRDKSAVLDAMDQKRPDKRRMVGHIGKHTGSITEKSSGHTG